mgnify:CR=1 FL=1
MLFRSNLIRTFITRKHLGQGFRRVERRVEFMILEFVGRVLLNVLKAMVWMALLMLRCVLGLAKLTLLVFGLVARVFLVFARAVVD